MDFKEQLANYVLGNGDRGSLIDAAIRALEEGYDTPALRILAGEPRKNFNPFEIEDCFETALRELGWALPLPLEAAERMVRYWCRQIVMGGVSPEEGATGLLEGVYRCIAPLVHESYVGEALEIRDLIGWCYTYGELSEGHIEYEGRSISIAEAYQIADANVRRAAQRYLDEHPAVDPDVRR